MTSLCSLLGLLGEDANLFHGRQAVCPHAGLVTDFSYALIYAVLYACNKHTDVECLALVRMHSDIFNSVNELSKTMTVRKQKVEWMKIQWICDRKAERLKMFDKYSVQEDTMSSVAQTLQRKVRSARMCQISSCYITTATTTFY